MFKPFNRRAPFKPPPYVLPRDAGEERGGVERLERFERFVVTFDSVVWTERSFETGRFVRVNEQGIVWNVLACETIIVCYATLELAVATR